MNAFESSVQICQEVNWGVQTWLDQPTRAHGRRFAIRDPREQLFVTGNHDGCHWALLIYCLDHVCSSPLTHGPPNNLTKDLTDGGWVMIGPIKHYQLSLCSNENTSTVTLLPRTLWIVKSLFWRATTSPQSTWTTTSNVSNGRRTSYSALYFPDIGVEQGSFLLKAPLNLTGSYRSHDPRQIGCTSLALKGCLWLDPQNQGMLRVPGTLSG